MYDLRLVPIAVVAGRELALSALPDAPVVPDTPRRERRWRRGLAERFVTPRPRLKATRFEEEAACGT